MVRSALALGAVLVSMVSQVSAQGLDPNQFYRLEPVGAPGQFALDVANTDRNQIFLARSADASGQYWRFSPVAGGKFQLTTMFRGDAMCLDVINGGNANNALVLASCNGASGQKWSIRNGSGGVQMTSDFRGSQMCLDVVPRGDGVHFDGMVGQCISARSDWQNWRIVATGRSAN